MYMNKAVYHCSICGDGIYENEEYLNNGCEQIHFDCIPSMRWLINWLGYDILEMKNYELYRN